MNEINVTSNVNNQIGKAKGAHGSFCSLLPDKERAAIILLLLEIAQSNDITNKFESNLIVQVLDQLSIACVNDRNEKGQQVLKQITDNMEIDEAIFNLKSLTPEQIWEAMMWFVLMVNLDDDNQRSLRIINNIAKSFGIDANQFCKKNEKLLLELIKDFTTNP